MKYLSCMIYRMDDNTPGLIGDKIANANSFFPRLKGLLGKQNLAEGEGIILSPCSSIHCFGMKFPIDVIFMDHNYNIIDLRADMHPGARASCRKARHVLELRAGEIERHQMQIGQQLEFKKIGA